MIPSLDSVSAQERYLRVKLSILATTNLDISFSHSYNVHSRIRMDAEYVLTVCREVVNFVKGMYDSSSVTTRIPNTLLKTLLHHTIATIGIAEDIIEHIDQEQYDSLHTDIALLLWETDNIAYQVDLIGGDCR